MLLNYDVCVTDSNNEEYETKLSLYVAWKEVKLFINQQHVYNYLQLKLVLFKRKL